MPQHVIVKAYNENYPLMYEKELIIPILNTNLVDIYHIGSTAVKNLKSKPIIDIMIVVSSLLEVDVKKENLEK